ncbi:hypothetical protein [Francisella hispaniensis]|uniref:Uncharacterized protein n=1 Tax=Francisella hispaniensis FSC454 TaxID=1088883 RepID=A0AAC9J5N2_9GAMM|nr:hypothetical protein [Francisella hispaniensis]APD50866.1 hypothetical protein FSC454_06995 [Francisella hispaniensis FSC454]KYW82614.1 hypothetical protein AUF42_07810 [Francisella hispaniensis FSC454]
MTKILSFDDVSKQEPIPLINNSIDEIYETLYQNGLEYILTDGTAEQKEIITIHLLNILSKDLDLLLGLFFELGDVADREYQDNSIKKSELKQRLIKLFDCMEAF